MSYELVGFLMVIIGVGIRIAAVERLRTRHYEIWVKLGSPMNVDQGSGDHASVRINKFFFKGEFLKVNDKVLKLLGILFILLVIVCVIFLVLLSIGYIR